METRRFGRSGHFSTIAILGGAAFWDVPQSEADLAMEQVIRAGVNHIDVAPSYGNAELRLGPWIQRERDRFFLGCKTTERSRNGAEEELQRSLKRLQTDHFDLYQLHAVNSMAELDQIFARGGALETFLAARSQGLCRYIGITGHGHAAPAIFLEALRRFDFDSVLFPLNPLLYSIPAYRQDAETLLAECQKKDVGVMTIKSLAKAPWGDQNKTHTTWYQPLVNDEQIQQAVNFVLSQKVTGLCTSGDTQLLPLLLHACENYTPISSAEQDKLLAGLPAEIQTIFKDEGQAAIQ